MVKRTTVEATLRGAFSLDDVWDCTFGDAGFNQRYHAMRGDRDLVVTDWERVADEPGIVSRRSISFTADLNAPYIIEKLIGSKTVAAHVIESRHFTPRGSNQILVVSESTLRGFPMADKFRSTQTYRLVEATGGAMGVAVQAVGEVEFTGNIWGVTGKIESDMEEKVRRGLELWMRVATERMREWVEEQQHRMRAQQAAAASASSSRVTAMSSPAVLPVAPPLVPSRPAPPAPVQRKLELPDGDSSSSREEEEEDEEEEEPELREPSPVSRPLRDTPSILEAADGQVFFDSRTAVTPNEVSAMTAAEAIEPPTDVSPPRLYNGPLFAPISSPHTSIIIDTEAANTLARAIHRLSDRVEALERHVYPALNVPYPFSHRRPPGQSPSTAQVVSAAAAAADPGVSVYSAPPLVVHHEAKPEGTNVWKIVLLVGSVLLAGAGAGLGAWWWKRHKS